MEKAIILRYSEIHLKGNNRKFFEDLLIENIKTALGQFSYNFQKTYGRYVISNYDESFEETIIEALNNLIKDFSTSKSIDFFIPSHGNILEDAEALTELNLIAIMETEASILEALQKERTMEELLKHIADINEIKLGDGQFVLIGSTLRSYLSYLQNEKKIFHIIKDNKMYWKKV